MSKRNKKWWWWTGGGAALVLVIIILIWHSANRPPETVSIGRGDVINQVSVSGKIESVQKANLAFEVGGTVKQILKHEGDAVSVGELIATLDTADLRVKLANQQAALERAKLALKDLTDPPKVVEQTSAQNAVATARDDVSQARDEAFNHLDTALANFPTALSELDDLIISPTASYLSDFSLRRLGARAETYHQDAEDAYWLAKKSYETTWRNYKQTPRTVDSVDLQKLLTAAYDSARLVSAALKEAYALITYLEQQDKTLLIQTAEDKATLDSRSSAINTALADLSASRDRLDQTERDRLEAEQKLTDLLDGADVNDIASSELAVKQAGLDIADTQVQIGKREIRAPFAGVVGKNNLDLGETITANDNVVFVIADHQYQAVAQVPEAEIANLHEGDAAEITLDAYPPEALKLAARVAKIDPAEEMVDGVATYKVEFQLLNQDERVRSGLTATILVTGATRSQALVVPLRALVTQAGQDTVTIWANGERSTRNVSVGLRGSNGLAEILSGVNAGEQVVVGATN